MRILPVLVLAACASGSPPDLHGLTDQQAAVGVELVIELDGTDPDGDPLSYRVGADFALAGATITQQPSGAGVFRWTPVAADVGMHVFDFTVSDGSHATTVSITVDVQPAIGASPVFREPLGTGSIVDLAQGPCITLAIVVEDQDTAQVTLGQEAPAIAGAELTQLDGTSGSWHWCPSAAQAAEERHTLILSADDGDHPKTIENYILVVRDGTASARLVIDEVDYDQVNTDGKEFIELFNPGAAALDVGGLQVVLVNGATNAVYDTIDLAPAGSIPAGGYLVIAGAGVTVPLSAIKLDPGWTTDRIQNGAPDGIALIDTVTHVVIDALSYEGSITSVALPGFPAPVSLVEGNPTAAADSNTSTLSLCRSPDGQDTDDAAADWTTCTSPTPGRAN